MSSVLLVLLHRNSVCNWVIRPLIKEEGHKLFEALELFGLSSHNDVCHLELVRFCKVYDFMKLDHHAGMVFVLLGKAGSVKWLLILAFVQPCRVVKNT